MLENLAMGFGLILQFKNIAAILAGTFIGYFVGALPGLNPTLGIALLIPFTFGMDPVTAMALLVSLYVACEYGGGITAILVNTPGTAAAAATALDGYPLAKQGKAGLALGMCMIGSAIGAFLGAIGLILFAVPLANFALSFGGPEYFALAVFGLSVVSSVSSGSVIKGLMAAALGVLITTIGLDPITSTERYVYSYDFLEGIPFVPAMIGLFAVSEVMIMLEDTAAGEYAVEKASDILSVLKELRRCMVVILRSTVIGFIVGVIPAAGANVASWLGYFDAKRISKHPELFGKGAIEGVASCETANNSAVPGAFVPLLTLGIPGSSAAAVLIGALMIQGLQPGPLLFERNPEIPYSIFAGLLLSTPIMLVVGLGGARLFAKLTLVPKSILGTVVLGVCLLGSFALGNNIFPVWIACGFGILGYLMRKFDFPIAAMVLAMVLGEMAENNFRLSMLMGEGSWSIFLTRPISLVIFLLTAVMFCWPLVNSWIRRKQAEVASPAPDKRNGR